MKVLRAGGEYLRRRRRNLGIALALTGIGAVAAGAVLQELPIWLAGGAVVLLVGARVLPRLASVRKGIRGETSVATLLKTLPDEYFLVNDVVLSGSRGNIDHVLVGPCGVVVIETKFVAGTVRVYGNHWYVNGIPRRSYSRQASSGAVAVKEHLKRKCYGLAENLFVKAVVILTNPTCRHKIIRAPRFVQVARYSQLLDYVLELARQTKLEQEVAKRIAESLIGSSISESRSSLELKGGPLPVSSARNHANR